VRRELITASAALATLIALAFVIPLALSARSTARDRALDDAQADAAALVPVVGGADLATITSAVERVNTRNRNQVTVLLGDTVVGPSIAAPARAMAAAQQTSSSVGPVQGGYEVVTAVAAEGGTNVIRVLVPERELERGVRAAWAALAAVALVLIGVSVALADRISQRVVRPVQDLARAARRLGAGDLEATVEPAGPTEVIETAVAFNQLTRQIRSMLVAERELMSELTHRLRTPLTRLRLDLDRVDDPELMAQLHRGVEAVTDEVNGLIARARRAADPPQPIDVVPVVAERYEFWSALAADEDRPRRLNAMESNLLVAVDPEELQAAVDVLIENVFAHTERGTPFEVTVAASGDSVVVAVDDGGPGFDPVLAGSGRSGAGSTGLGLAIVDRLARAAGGRTEITPSPLGGARVSCHLARSRSNRSHQP
jgi:signal transduction histidine kinase